MAKRKRKTKSVPVEFWPNEFAKTGAKIGSTLRIRIPSDFKIEDKSKLALETPYHETASFRSRLEAATIKYENAVNEVVQQLKGTD